METKSDLTVVEQALLLATYFRGRLHTDQGWTSNSDQILTLSLFYTGDISSEECVRRFSKRSYFNQSLYNDECELPPEIENRYRLLIKLLKSRSDLINGGGNFDLPAHPTFTACGLTEQGFQLAKNLMASFPSKPDFPNWPDRKAVGRK